MVTRIKICGLTNAEDLRSAVAAGADAVGFNMYPASPRFVGVDQVAALCRQTPVFVTRVGLFVNHSRAEVEAVCSQAEFDLLQFHGDEDNAFCASFGRPFIKALRVADPASVGSLIAAFPDSRGILLDAHVDGVYGGTGQVIDWGALPAAGKPLVLAGGLTPENVGQAILTVQPWAVDVSGGVELTRGRKDPERILEFVSAVRSADASLITGEQVVRT
ncbi:MAG: phosphoribosylanthranilate isomerase [Pseudomonadales bacterium]|nr:phosphoribosylanthranilate isomerase [Pseudomonadales bacterium]